MHYYSYCTNTVQFEISRGATTEFELRRRRRRRRRRRGNLSSAPKKGKCRQVRQGGDGGARSSLLPLLPEKDVEHWGTPQEGRSCLLLTCLDTIQLTPVAKKEGNESFKKLVHSSSSLLVSSETEDEEATSDGVASFLLPLPSTPTKNVFALTDSVSPALVVLTRSGVEEVATIFVFPLSSAATRQTDRLAGREKQGQNC